MPTILTDEQIKNLIAEPKLLTSSYHSQMQLKDKIGHKEGELNVTGANGKSLCSISTAERICFARLFRDFNLQDPNEQSAF